MRRISVCRVEKWGRGKVGERVWFLDCGCLAGVSGGGLCTFLLCDGEGNVESLSS